MSCSQLQNVSAWIDGELAPEVAARFLVHIETCAECQRAAFEFRSLGDNTRRAIPKTEDLEETAILARLVQPKRANAPRRGVVVPAPLAAVAAAALVVMAFWVGVLEFRDKKSPPGARLPTDTPGAVDLSRFDKGERAVVYKEVWTQ